MIRAPILFAGALSALALAAAPRSAAACYTCTWQVVCDRAPSGGGSCHVYYDGGRTWCSDSGDCHTSITMSPLEVSPSGTYLAGGGVQVREDGVQKQGCNGFITGHLAAGAGPAGARTLRI